eukprot:TRINITY_DN42895_c0_g1_i1.p1 TRINITY_DN42895_c0_g1~~TRINITY_DN42895_c0_g1_i1.p1  ORF type:complete len:237 (+),score=38.78 TRINITY_DN42895_c0_g1_i1:71-712(+)
MPTSIGFSRTESRKADKLHIGKGTTSTEPSWGTSSVTHAAICCECAVRDTTSRYFEHLGKPMNEDSVSLVVGRARLMLSHLWAAKRCKVSVLARFFGLQCLVNATNVKPRSESEAGTIDDHFDVDDVSAADSTESHCTIMEHDVEVEGVLDEEVAIVTSPFVEDDLHAVLDELLLNTPDQKRKKNATSQRSPSYPSIDRESETQHKDEDTQGE